MIRARPVWIRSLKLFAGLILLVTLLSLIDLDELWRSLQQASVPLLLLAFVLFALQCVPESIRLKTAYADWEIGWSAGLRLYTIGLFFNNFLPGMIGADVYQVQQLRSIRPGLVRPISMLLLLRVSGMLVNFFLVLMILALGVGTAWELLDFDWLSSRLPEGLPIYLVTIFGFLALLALTPWGRSVANVASQRLIAVGNEVRAALATLTALAIITIFLQSFLSIFLRAASLYVVLWALGAQADAVDVLLAVTVAILVMVVPITLAGIGVREISLSTVLVASGTEPHLAVAAALIGRFFIWTLSLLGWGWFVARLR